MMNDEYGMQGIVTYLSPFPFSFIDTTIYTIYYLIKKKVKGGCLHENQKKGECHHRCGDI